VTPGRRIGLLGGAFDPPHQAHVALARAALSQLALDELRVVPTGQPWHRPQMPSAAAHRVAMCRLAFDGVHGVVVDDRETRRPGPTYTIDTVRSLQAEMPGNDWFLIIGADQARALSGWHQWEELLRLVHLVVADRDPALGQWQNIALSGAIHLNFPPIDVSATRIRQALSSGQAASWLNTQVLGYIHQHQLYSTPSK
jgi:nicotinate-nucleotide adenylyltransferase